MKVKELKYFIAVLFFLLACYLFSGKWGGEPLASISTQERTPASIQKVFDYSYLEGEALTRMAKDRLAGSIRIETTAKKDDVVIEIGNFVLTNDKKEKDFACGFYDHVTLTFEAEGVAVGGNKPLLILDAGCEVAGNINELIPLHIPLAKLLTQKPADSEYKFYDTKSPVTVKIKGAPAQWPTKWILGDVKLTHTKFSARILKVESFKQSISMNW